MTEALQNSIDVLFQGTMRPIMQAEAKTHNGLFLTQTEFEKNMGKIFIITNAKRTIEDKLNYYEQENNKTTFL